MGYKSPKLKRIAERLEVIGANPYRGATIFSAKNHGLRLMDRDSARNGPVRTIMAAGKLVEPINLFPNKNTT